MRRFFAPFFGGSGGVRAKDGYPSNPGGMTRIRVSGAT
jgi:hypothetical protein